MDGYSYTTLYKVWAAVEGEPALLREAFGYQYKPYLVPRWEEGPEGAWRRPEWLIPLEPFGCEALKDDPDGADFRVATPIPRSLWSGPPSAELVRRYGVLVRPPGRLWQGGR